MIIYKFIIYKISNDIYKIYKILYKIYDNI